MSDTLAPAQQDTPTPGAPEEGHAQDQPNWEERYNNLRSDYNRRDQEIAEARQYREWADALTNPETQPQALQALGVEIQTEAAAAQQQQQQPFIDPYEQRLAQLETHNQQLLAAEQARQQAAQQQAEQDRLTTHIGASVNTLEQQLGRQFQQHELELLVAKAYQTPGQDGMPDVSAAWNSVQEYERQAQERWLESKKTQGVPGGGQAGSKEYDLSTPQGRQEYAAARLASMDDETVLT